MILLIIMIQEGQYPSHSVDYFKQKLSGDGIIINLIQAIIDTHSCWKDVLRFGSCGSVINRSDALQIVQVGIPVDCLTIGHTETPFPPQNGGERRNKGM